MGIVLPETVARRIKDDRSLDCDVKISRDQNPVTIDVFWQNIEVLRIDHRLVDEPETINKYLPPSFNSKESEWQNRLRLLTLCKIKTRAGLHSILQLDPRALHDAIQTMEEKTDQ